MSIIKAFRLKQIKKLQKREEKYKHASAVMIQLCDEIDKQTCGDCFETMQRYRHDAVCEIRDFRKKHFWRR